MINCGDEGEGERVLDGMTDDSGVCAARRGIRGLLLLYGSLTDGVRRMGLGKLHYIVYNYCIGVCGTGSRCITHQMVKS